MTQTTVSTSWRHVLIAFTGGCMISIHIGKLPAAIPFLIDEFGVDLFWAGLVVSAFSLITGLVGLLTGGLADRFGHDRAAYTGLACVALGALLGALAPGIGWLLAARVLEGLGYLLGVVSLPALISASSTDHDRPLALGIWGAFMPAGTSAMLLAAPWLIEAIGWRGLWTVTGALSLAWYAVLIASFRGHPLPTREALPLAAALRLVTRRGPLLLVACFVAYAGQFMAVTSFIPTLFIDAYRITVTAAASLGALVVAGNIVGNIAGGWLLRHGLRAATLLAVGAGCMGLCSLVIYSDLFPLAARTVAALLFTSAGGLIPGVLLASAPRHIERPGQMASIMGLLLQGAGVGQVAGPVILAATVGVGGWAAAPLFTVSAALVGVGCAVALGRASRTA